MVLVSAAEVADQGAPGPGLGAPLDLVSGGGRDIGLIRSHCPGTSLGSEFRGSWELQTGDQHHC